MKPLSNGTRRSSYPTFCAVNGIKHNQKIKKYLDVGYVLVSENGFSATLAYVLHSKAYVKIVSVEHGKVTDSIKITPKQLKLLTGYVTTKKEKAS